MHQDLIPGELPSASPCALVWGELPPPNREGLGGKESPRQDGGFGRRQLPKDRVLVQDSWFPGADMRWLNRKKTRRSAERRYLQKHTSRAPAEGMPHPTWPI